MICITGDNFRGIGFVLFVLRNTGTATCLVIVWSCDVCVFGWKKYRDLTIAFPSDKQLVDRFLPALSPSKYTDVTMRLLVVSLSEIVVTLVIG